MKRVTIKDIAKKLGIAYSTVSMALHDDRTIGQAMKEKVRKTAKEMGYYPNRSARNLVKGNTNNIAVVSPGFFSIYEMTILRGMEQKLTETKYDLVYYTGRYDWNGVHDIMRKILYEHTADAVIVIGVMLESKVLEEYKKGGVPLVLIDAGEHDKGHIINVDNYHAGRIAAEYFIRSKRKTPALIVGNTDYAFSQAKRLQGYKETLDKAGIKLDKGLIHERPEYLPEDLRQVGNNGAELFLKKNTDAIFCANGDYVAQGVFKHLKAGNIEVPEKVSIVGCDNFDVAETLELTSVQQPLMEIGNRAFEVAEKAAKAGKVSYEIEYFKPKLVVRNT